MLYIIYNKKMFAYAHIYHKNDDLDCLCLSIFHSSGEDVRCLSPPGPGLRVRRLRGAGSLLALRSRASPSPIVCGSAFLLSIACGRFAFGRAREASVPFGSGLAGPLPNRGAGSLLAFRSRAWGRFGSWG
jgi:hypothetical protein